VAVVGAAAPAQDAQAEVFVDLPHLLGEALWVVAFGVVKLDEFLGAKRGGVSLELVQPACDEVREKRLYSI
jgi:hypothetical protein